MKVLTFGEIMLRLKAPGHERFFQSPMLEATFGGGEARVRAFNVPRNGIDDKEVQMRMRLVQVFDDSAEVFTEPTSQPLDGELLPHLVVVPIRRVTRYARQQYGCIFP